ncbi:ROK family protein [Burkholderia sp. MR1-5-21]
MIEPANKSLAVGLDLGGTQVRAALVDCNGNVIERAAQNTDVLGGPIAILRQFRQLIDTVRGEVAIRDLAGIGIGAPGPLDTVEGVVLGIPTLPGWEQLRLHDVMSQEYGLPVVVENDAKAAAVGEWKFGAGKGCTDLVYVTVSTGIGGGVIADGRLLQGRRGMAAHVGHFAILPGGPQCSCGANGCFEALASGTALGRAARQAALDHPESALGVLAKSRAVTSRDAVDAARKGDAVAVELLEQEAHWLGVGLTGLIHIFSPERVVLGGGVSLAFDLIKDGIDKVIQSTAMEPFRDVVVAAAALGDNAGLVGAATLAFNSSEKF